MLIELKCRNCNSNLKIDSSRKLFFCEACGTQYILSNEEREENQNDYLTFDDSYDESEKAAEEELEHQRAAEVEQRAFWIRNRLCRHCGGEFEGRIFKKCKKCGTPKDY